MSAPGLIIAAPHSRAGKTLVTLAIVRALTKSGRRVGSFKVGPDYIDPAFHRRAGATDCPNLDSWAMRPQTLIGLAAEAATGVDLVVGEGVMGLFDGAPDGRGSTADLAAMLGYPVVLVVDAGGMGQSVAALVEGFAKHRADVDVAGVIFNRVGSRRHADMLANACAERLSVARLGALPTAQGLAMPERHLGLVQACERDDLEDFLDRAAAHVSGNLDLERLVRLARPSTLRSLAAAPVGLAPLGQRIAVARDAAFGFAYPSVLEAWQRAGAEILPFSPLADEAPSSDCDSVYLPGGYPELHANTLAAAARFKQGMTDAADRGARIFGECGGYMVLGQTLTDAEGTPHAMLGLLPVATSFAQRRLHLGYRKAQLQSDCILGAVGTVFAGHEFHYARETTGGGTPLFRIEDATDRSLGSSGSTVGSVAGSFIHLIDKQSDPALSAQVA